jgi:alanine racemase
MHNTVIEINSKQFIANIQAIRAYIDQNSKNLVANPIKTIEHAAKMDENAVKGVENTVKTPVKICLPIKANAYGHGLVGIAKLASPCVEYLAVACLDEGVELRQNGINKLILVLGAFSQEQIAGLIAYDLEITISSLHKAHLVADFCRTTNKKCRVQIKIDTGMNRIGVRFDSAFALIDFVINHSQYMELVGIYSHFACSDEVNSPVNHHQIELFRQCVEYVRPLKPDVICHLANSGGVCYFKESYFDMVRPGILAYGYFPSGKSRAMNNYNSSESTALDAIAPCFSLKSQVTYFKVVLANQGISYNHKYITKETTRVVTIPIGYGDGYRRALSNLGQVIIRGKKYTISGSVCMDMLMVDIGAAGEAYVGDEVILIGYQGNETITLAEVATKCDSITYEILCGFNQRIPRVYVES